MVEIEFGRGFKRTAGPRIEDFNKNRSLRLQALIEVWIARRDHGSETKELTRPCKSIDAVFIEAVRTKDGSQIRSPYSDAVKSLAISLAANESGMSGAPKIL